MFKFKPGMLCRHKYELPFFEERNFLSRNSLILADHPFLVLKSFIHLNRLWLFVLYEEKIGYVEQSFLTEWEIL